jgi:hypothetical protein
MAFMVMMIWRMGGEGEEGELVLWWYCSTQMWFKDLAAR